MFCTKLEVLKQNQYKFSPEEVTAILLQKLKADADEFLNYQIESLTIATPCYYNANQRKALDDACKIAFKDSNVEARYINSVSAVALRYAKDDSEIYRVCAIDFGAETFSVGVFHHESAVIETSALHGSCHLGGDDFTERIVELCINKLDCCNIIALNSDTNAKAWIRREAERAKLKLSEENSVEIILQDEQWEIDFHYTLTR